jgi:tRNA-Thr(GGU) m(6)t(6)A37 methyltransferase TsaA
MATAADSSEASEQGTSRSFCIIGVVHSPFLTPAGTPVQPSCAGPEAVGTVDVFEEYAAGLDDLYGFERIWVLSWFHRAGAARLRVIPYLDCEERGLFATRAPARPNPIGLSAVRLLRREGCRLHVADLDLIDGTPVLDLKPYAAAFDSYPGSREGWLQGRGGGGGRGDDRFAADP